MAGTSRDLMPERDLAADAARLRALHHDSMPLVLPNAWDVASAVAVERAGFPVVATSSAAVAKSLGAEDNDSMRPDLAFDAVERIATAVDVPVTVDIEAGYQLEPGAIIQRLLDAGAVGFNVEDTDHHGGATLVSAPTHVDRIAALRSAASEVGVDVVINARVDVHLRMHEWDPQQQLEEALHRSRLYLEAGADCVYPIALSDERSIEAFTSDVDAPVNILRWEGSPSAGRLAELGVARVSFGGGLFYVAHRAIEETLDDIRNETAAGGR